MKDSDSILGYKNQAAAKNMICIPYDFTGIVRLEETNESHIIEYNLLDGELNSIEYSFKEPLDNDQ